METPHKKQQHQEAALPQKRAKKNVVLPPIRVSGDEREDIRMSAKDAGLTVSEFARRRLFDRPLSPRPENQIDGSMLTELNKLSVALRSGVGNNLNQLVRDWNSGRNSFIDWQTTHGQLESTLVALNDLIERVAEAYE